MFVVFKKKKNPFRKLSALPKKLLLGHLYFLSIATASVIWGRRFCWWKITNI